VLLRRGATAARRTRILTMKQFVLCMVLGVAMAAPVAAQQRPLVTEDPETVGEGVLLFETGFDYTRDTPFPVSGLEGHLLAVPTAGVSIGLSPIAELQVDGGFYQRLNITSRQPAPLDYLIDRTGDTVSDGMDLTVATKIRLVSEAAGRTALGLRVATQLPAASNETGLGTDSFNFFTSLLIGKTTQSVRVVGNVGLGIMADPVEGNRQNDLLTYGVSIARAVADGAEIVSELNGRINVRDAEDIPPGTDTRGMLRVGARLTRGPVRVDGGLLVGLTSRDPSWGLTGGVTWVLRGFSLP
jgi:hypothetical protein